MNPNKAVLYFHLGSHDVRDWEDYMEGAQDLTSEDFLKMEEDAQDEAVELFEPFGFKKSHNEGHDEFGDLVNSISIRGPELLSSVWQNIEEVSGEDDGTIHFSNHPLFFIRDWVFYPEGVNGPALYGEEIREWLEEEEIAPY